MTLPPHLQSLPEDQKVRPFLPLNREAIYISQAMLMKVLAMTPEQINMLAPSERASIMQLVCIYSMRRLPGVLCGYFQRATLG
jgi:hypothetical protein